MKDPLLVVCPDCQGVNRVPQARMREHPVCGVCRQPLFTAQPVALDGKTFERHITRNSIPVLVDFWAPWCGPCHMMAPAYEQLAARLEPAVRVAKLDTEANPTLAGQYGIRSIPTLILFSQGREKDRRSGAMGLEALMSWVQPLLA